MFDRSQVYLYLYFFFNLSYLYFINIPENLYEHLENLEIQKSQQKDTHYELLLALHKNQTLQLHSY